MKKKTKVKVNINRQNGHNGKKKLNICYIPERIRRSNIKYPIDVLAKNVKIANTERAVSGIAQTERSLCDISGDRNLPCNTEMTYKVIPEKTEAANGF